MSHPTPRSLAEIVTDGAIARADADAAFAAFLGRCEGVEFNRDGERMQVRFHRQSRSDVDASGAVVAEIHAGEWTWCSDVATDAAARFGISELTGTQPAGDSLFAAARTIHGCRPGFLAPMPGGETAVVCLDPPLPLGDTRTALITAAATPGILDDLPRALSGFAAIRGLDVRVESGIWSFSDGTSVRVRNGRLHDIIGGLDIDQIRSDAVLTSSESQMYLDAVLPGAVSTADPLRGLITLRTPDGTETSVKGVVLATITNDTWTWGWADPYISSAPGTAPCHLIREFGRRQGIPVFISPTVPLPLARDLDLVSASKPVLGRWYHTTVNLNPETWAIMIFADDSLVLPPSTIHTVSAVIDTIIDDRMPDRISAQRAVEAYSRFRGLGHEIQTGPPPSLLLNTVDGTVNVHFSTDDRVVRIGID
ncbi:DUF6882 domain-containing protein [Corynebacterium sp. CCM 9203]|uniref:DUF6882 domain-containing protein n=1 Tax=Corynebacterium sp. CCM 9203 TaxID=3057615 RepID=UPI0035258C8C